MAVARVSRDQPCVVCGGTPDLPRGQGIRCTGFVTETGSHAFCTREDRAGPIPLDTSTSPWAYPHRLRAACDCGVIHMHGGASVPARGSRVGRAERVVEATYPYLDARGTLLYEVVRFTPKGFSQRRPDGNGGHVWDLKGVARVPYRLPELVGSEGPVVVCEGEKAVDALRARGLVATTAPGGAGKWRAEYGVWLRGREVVVIPDHDEPGEAGALHTAGLLARVASSVRVVPLPDQEEHEGADDWLRSHDLASLAALIAATEPFSPPLPEPNGHAGNGGGGGGPRGDSVAPPPPVWGYTDTRNAARLAAVHGWRLRFDHTRGLWRIWDGRCWRLDETDQIMCVAKEVIATCHRDLDEMEDQEKAAKLRGAVLACESTGRLRSMLESAKSLLPSTHDTYDRDAWLLNCANGILNLRSGDLGAHDPERMQSKITEAAYSATAVCPRWLAFLDRIFAGDQDLIAFVQRAAGLALVGEVVEHVLFVLWGTGRNGKSVLLDAMLKAVGEYGRPANPDLLMEHETPSHSTNIAELRGVRMVTAIETAGSGRLSEVLVKTLTGGDPRNARFLFKDSFVYWPSDTVFLATNHKPVIRDNSEGVWRRIRLVPFTVTIPEAEDDRDLGHKLVAEQEGILAWMVAGCTDWQAHGLGTPAAVAEATASYRDDVDTIGGFLADCCVLEAHGLEAAASLYERYGQWCTEMGEKAASQRFFGLRLTDRGYRRKRHGRANRWHWEGLRLSREGEFPGLTAETPAAEGASPAELITPEKTPYANSTELLGASQSADPTPTYDPANPYNPYVYEGTGIYREGGNTQVTGSTKAQSSEFLFKGNHGSRVQPFAPEPPATPRREDFADQAGWDDAFAEWARQTRAWHDAAAGITPPEEDP